MKNLKFIALAALLLGAISCQEDPELPKPVIKLGQSEVVITSEGTSESIGYYIENPIEGEKVAVEFDAEWLTVNTTKARSLQFSAPLNDSGAERSTTVTLSYKDAESVTLNIRQEYYASPLKFEVSDVTATEVLFSVTTLDEELTWVPMILSKSNFEYFPSDEDLFEFDMEYMQYSADNQEVSLETYLERVLAVGSVEGIYFDNLFPETEYVLYAYGLTSEGVRTTEIVSHYFTTEKAWEGDITVTFEISEENHIVTFEATPDYTGVPYYCYYATEAQMDEWRNTYGTDDLKTLIRQGSIGELLDGLKEVGFFDDEKDFYDFFNNTGSVRDAYFPCKASTKYIFFAVKWNEQCELLGEVSSCEYTTQPVEPSDNQITLEVGAISQSTVEVKATTTNDDPYTIMPVKSSDLEGKTTQEIFEFVDAHYYLSEFTFSGNKTKIYSALEPGTDYTLVAFGYKAKSLTTSEITKLEFRTQSSNSVEDCTFEFTYEVFEESVFVTVKPSDKGHHYFWHVYDARYTADDVKAHIKEMIDEGYEGDAAAFASWWLHQGDQSEEKTGLYPDTEYRVAVVIMDHKTGEILSDVIFSDVFKTPEKVYADAQINVAFGPYYDIDALAEAGETKYKDSVANDERFEGVGGALLPTTIEVDSNIVKFFYDIYRQDLTDTTVYNDSIFLEGLYASGSTARKTNFLVSYDIYWTIAAVAMDRTGNVTPVYRKRIMLTKDGASDVSGFLSAPNAAPIKCSAVEWSNIERLSMADLTPRRK